MNMFNWCCFILFLLSIVNINFIKLCYRIMYLFRSYFASLMLLRGRIYKFPNFVGFGIIVLVFLSYSINSLCASVFYCAMTV